MTMSPEYPELNVTSTAFSEVTLYSMPPTTKVWAKVFAPNMLNSMVSRNEKVMCFI